MTGTTFSVVTPVRNGMPQLRGCVGSIRAQSEVTVQHVVQDSCSTDGTTEWLAGQPGVDVVSERDDGMYDAINRGWRRSTGDVLSWLNADEQYLPGTLAAVADVFLCHPEVEIVFGDALIVDPTGALIAARREIPLRRVYVAGTFLYALSCATFFRRSLLDAGELVFNPERRVAGDAELVLSLLRKGHRSRHVARYLSLFTIDGRNLSLSPDARVECLEVRGRGAGRVPALLASSARRAEKAVRGCYARQPVSYVWAEDERPTYRELSYDRAPTRFEWGSPAETPEPVVSSPRAVAGGTGILFLHSSDEAYGSDRVLVQLVGAALETGFSVTVLLPDDTGPGWLSDTLAKFDVTVKKGPLAPARRRYLAGRALLGYAPSVLRARRFIRQELQRLDPAVVHVNSTALPVMALVGRRPGTKVVWHVHEILVSPRALALVFRLLPLLVADRVVAISGAVADHLKRVPVHRDRVVRIYNGVAARHPARAVAHDAGVTAVFAGRLSGWKGYDLFIDSVASVSGRFGDLSAVVAGGPPPGEEWRADDVVKRIADAGLAGRVSYLGFVDDVGRLFGPGRIVVVPSRWPEPFGLVTVEAMLAGCAVVASRHGGSVEIIEDGVTGLLVPPGDAIALAEAVERLAADPDLRRELGARARTSAAERFGSEVFAEAMAGLWTELTGR